MNIVDKARYRVTEISPKMKKIVLIGATVVLIAVSALTSIKKPHTIDIPKPDLPKPPGVVLIDNQQEEKVEKVFTVSSGTNIRLTPSQDGVFLGRVNEDADYNKLSVISEYERDDDRWFLVRYGNHIGYISADYCKNLSAFNGGMHNLEAASGYVQAIENNINIRLDPWIEDNNNYSDKIKYAQFAKVLGIVEQENLAGKWYLVSYGSRIGFVDARFFNYYPDFTINDCMINQKFVEVHGDGVRIRTSRNKDTNGNIFTSSNKGGRFVYLGEDNEWYAVLVEGKEMYIHKSVAGVIEETVIPDYLVNTEMDTGVKTI